MYSVLFNPSQSLEKSHHRSLESHNANAVYHC